MTTTECPDRQVLRSYILGECPDEISDVLERHIVGCPACEDTLAQFDSVADTLMRHLPLAAANRSRGSAAPGWIDALRGNPPSEQPNDRPLGQSKDLAASSQKQSVAELADGFANYDVLGVLGRGGMGVVFLARHKQLNRRVALKVVRPDALSSDLAHRRF